MQTPRELETFCKLLFDWSNEVVTQGDGAETVLVLEVVCDARFASANALQKISV